MAKVIKLTEDGLRKLEQELESLKTAGRKDIAERIKVARGYGDLSENSEYDDAKNEQAKIEARIAELEAMLKNYEIISDAELNGNKVVIGMTVEVKDVAEKKNYKYRIVGSAEADPMNDRISDESPVGKALLGHSVGDKVIVETPGDPITYKIVAIEK